MADAGRRAARGLDHDLDLATADGGERIVQDASGPVFGRIRDGSRREPLHAPADARQGIMRALRRQIDHGHDVDAGRAACLGKEH